MENWITNSLCGASAVAPRAMRERAVAPMSAVQGTGLPVAGAYGSVASVGTAAPFGFGFQSAARTRQHAITGTPVKSVLISNTDVDVRVPPRGRPL